MEKEQRLLKGWTRFRLSASGVPPWPICATLTPRYVCSGPQEPWPAARARAPAHPRSRRLGSVLCYGLSGKGQCLKSPSSASQPWRTNLNCSGQKKEDCHRRLPTPRAHTLEGVPPLPAALPRPRLVQTWPPGGRMSPEEGNSEVFHDPQGNAPPAPCEGPDTRARGVGSASGARQD